jgi:hypothetical protein
MRRRNLTLTEPLIRAARLLRGLDDLKTADAELIKSGTAIQRSGINRAIARRQRLRREIQRWLSDETRAQHGHLPIGDWED